MRLALALLLAAAAPAAAQDAYVDDRSTPAALARSLYNAINRGEYARAYSYFATPPSPTLEAYAKGYDGTEHVEIVTGTPREEAAAGSVYFELPIAIRATNANGTDSVFAGCYTMRMPNPAIAEQFEPLHIERGSLRPASGLLENALPRRCGDGPELPENDAALERAKAIYAAASVDVCPDSDGQLGADAEPEVYTFGYNESSDSADEPERTARLFRFLCGRGAYNEGHLYFATNRFGEVEPLHFAVPVLDIRYVDDDSEKAVESVRIVGFSTKSQLVNSDFDLDTRTLHEFVKWRGLGDASSSGTWTFRDGRFALVHYHVDASYDGEHNGEVILDYETAP